MTDRRPERPDRRELPNYTLAESARWLGLAPNTLRVWLAGQNYRTQEGTKRMLPVVRPVGRNPLELSFWNLVECSVLASIRKTHKVSFRKVRRALAFDLRQADWRRDGGRLHASLSPHPKDPSGP